MEPAHHILNGDPIPWLLEPENPSARYLTLRDLFDAGDADLPKEKAQEAILRWGPVQQMLHMMDPVHFWGRASNPFYGGAMSTHATLKLLAELGVPLTEDIRSACENLLQTGQHKSGGFTYDGTPGRRMLCYTGTSARTLIHFGYWGDERVERALEYIVTRVTTPGGLVCPYADHRPCQWSVSKALGALAAVPAIARDDAHAEAVQALADAVLDYEFDFEGRDERWMRFGFPLDYQSELTELCDMLAQLDYGPDPRFSALLELIVAQQTEDGRWLKQYGTRALQVEKRGEPSKWVTLRVLRTLQNAKRTELNVGRIRVLGEMELS